MIEGVVIQSLNQFTDDRGSVIHMVRCTDKYKKDICGFEDQVDLFETAQRLMETPHEIQPKKLQKTAICFPESSEEN